MLSKRRTELVRYLKSVRSSSFFSVLGTGMSLHLLHTIDPSLSVFLKFPQEFRSNTLVVNILIIDMGGYVQRPSCRSSPIHPRSQADRSLTSDCIIECNGLLLQTQNAK